jgi:hypothetical protein
VVHLRHELLAEVGADEVIDVDHAYGEGCDRVVIHIQVGHRQWRRVMAAGCQVNCGDALSGWRMMWDLLFGEYL